MLYRVRIGEDEYIGRAEEVVYFMARAEGAPGDDPTSYMEGVAARAHAQLHAEGVRTSDPESFLDSLDELGIVPVEAFAERKEGHVSPDEALGDGPVVLGEGVDPEDVDL